MSFSQKNETCHLPKKTEKANSYYAVAFSPNLTGGAIFKNWNAASTCCVDSRTGNNTLKNQNY
jgi:hypothetical protein